jgi:hypothetical protein
MPPTAEETILAIAIGIAIGLFMITLGTFVAVSWIIERWKKRR